MRTHIHMGSFNNAGFKTKQGWKFDGHSSGQEHVCLKEDQRIWSKIDKVPTLVFKLVFEEVFFFTPESAEKPSLTDMCIHSEYYVCVQVHTCVYGVLISLCVYVSMSYTLMVSPWAREPSSCTNTTSASLVTRTISSCPSASMSYCSHIRKRRKQMPSSLSLSPHSHPLPSLSPSPSLSPLTLTLLPHLPSPSLSLLTLNLPPHSPSPSPRSLPPPPLFKLLGEEGLAY